MVIAQPVRSDGYQSSRVYCIAHSIMFITAVGHSAIMYCSAQRSTQALCNREQPYSVQVLYQCVMIKPYTCWDTDREHVMSCIGAGGGGGEQVMVQ